jgi:hypothetical protein
MKQLLLIITSIAAVAVLAGCASPRGEGNSQCMAVTHAPLERIEMKRSGTILVKAFADLRPQKDKRAIGRIPWAFAPGVDLYFLPADPLNIDILMTEFVAEALREAGYDAVIECHAGTGEPISSGAVLQGEIRDFWLYGGPLRSQQKISVVLTLQEGNGKKILWKNKIAAVQEGAIVFTAVMGEWGFKGATIVRPALSDALNQAARAFASAEFYRCLKPTEAAMTNECFQGAKSLGPTNNETLP